MSKKTGFALVLGLSCIATMADARNDRIRLPLANVLNSPQAQARLDPAIALYFGQMPYAPPAQHLGVFTANEKTNVTIKNDVDGCNWVFLSAVRKLQEYARRQGGNAIVNVISIYKNQPFSSETEFECGAGTFVGGVALRGEVVSLR
ncbi:MAG TPA: excinuclease ATPase subunit [Polyangia bacterium]|nr:excinuclease ATPase subunit [Polyangia bacterium]